MNAALMNSLCPVLILPQKVRRRIGKRIVIAWNQSAEVARVVSACMPLLQKAEQVSILTSGPENRAGPKSGQLQNYLKAYGVKSKIHSTRGRHEEKELLESYRTTRSDLLLMGAYSRARFRELVFGGMTQHMLSKARMPVIMQHS